MAKFTVHYEGGMFSGIQSRSKDVAIVECDKLNSYAYVAEEYIAPSPFTGKPTKHGKIVHENKNLKKQFN